MPKSRACPTCTQGVIKNHKAKNCWSCYLKYRPLPKTVFKKGKNAGQNHVRWKGGTVLYWRKVALKRDDYTCQNCKLQEKEIMDVAHIVPINGNKNRRVLHPLNNADNLVTLCPNCHRRFDKGIIELR